MDVSASSATLTLTVHVTDDLSGVSQGMVGAPLYGSIESCQPMSGRKWSGFETEEKIGCAPSMVEYDALKPLLTWEDKTMTKRTILFAGVTLLTLLTASAALAKTESGSSPAEIEPKPSPSGLVADLDKPVCTAAQLAEIVRIADEVAVDVPSRTDHTQVRLRAEERQLYWQLRRACSLPVGK